MKLREIQHMVHALAVAKGWWQEPRNTAEIIALCHSELSEALEELREPTPRVFEIADNGKPEGWAVELADCIIRILDFCEAHGIDLEHILIMKHDYNKSRSHKHGKVF